MFKEVNNNGSMQARGVNPGDWGVTTPRFCPRGSWWVTEGSWTSREILLYLIMYRKFFRNWWLLKRNRIICSEVALNEHFFPGKSIFFKNSMKKSICFKILPGKNKLFGNFPGKIDFFKLPEKSKFANNDSEMLLKPILVPKRDIKVSWACIHNYTCTRIGLYVERTIITPSKAHNISRQRTHRIIRRYFDFLKST